MCLFHKCPQIKSVSLPTASSSCSPSLQSLINSCCAKIRGTQQTARQILTPAALGCGLKSFWDIPKGPLTSVLGFVPIPAWLCGSPCWISEPWITCRLPKHTPKVIPCYPFSWKSRGAAAQLRQGGVSLPSVALPAAPCPWCLHKVRSSSGLCAQSLLFPPKISNFQPNLSCITGQRKSRWRWAPINPPEPSGFLWESLPWALQGCASAWCPSGHTLSPHGHTLSPHGHICGARLLLTHCNNPRVFRI